MSIDLEQEFMSTEYHDLSDPESLPSPSPTPSRLSPSRLSPSISSAPSTSLPLSDAATFVLPQSSSSAAPREDAPKVKVSHAEDDPIDLAHPFKTGHSPWRLQWKKDNPNWRYSAEDAEDRIARGLPPIRDEATLRRELDKLVNRPPGPVVIAPLQSRRPKAEVDGPWRHEVKEKSEGVEERTMKSRKGNEGEKEESLS